MVYQTSVDHLQIPLSSYGNTCDVGPQEKFVESVERYSQCSGVIKTFHNLLLPVSKFIGGS